MDAVQLLSHFEAAQKLSMLPARVARLAKRGEIPAVLLPDGELRFEASELDEWIRAHRVKREAGRK